MLGSEYDLEMHVQHFGCPISSRMGAKIHLFSTFWRLRNLMAKLAVYVFRKKHAIDGIDSRASILKQWGFLCSLKISSTLVQNGLKLDRYFYLPSVYSAFYFIAGHRTQRSANETPWNFAKRLKINRPNSSALEKSIRIRIIYRFSWMGRKMFNNCIVGKCRNKMSFKIQIYICVIHKTTRIASPHRI